MTTKEKVKKKKVTADRHTELEKLFSVLLKSDNNCFFGHLAVKMERHIFDEDMIPGVESFAAINFSSNQNFVLMVSENFFKLTNREQLAIIKHEVYHIVNLHIIRVTIQEYSLNSELYNICMDLEINQFLNDLPKGAVTLDTIKQSFKIELEPEKKFEEYFFLLKKKLPKSILKQFKSGKGQGQGQGEGGEEGGEGEDDQDGNGGKGNENKKGKGKSGKGKKLPKNFDSHPYLDKLINDDGSVSQDYSKLLDKAREMVFQAKDDVERCRGSIPGNIQDIIRELFKVDPFLMLRDFIGRVPSANKEVTYFRADRRTGMIPATKREFRDKIMVCIDTSGSIGDAEMILFLAHIETLVKRYNTKTELNIVFCDTGVTHVIHNYECAARNIIGKKIDYGRGGTSFLPALELVKTDRKMRDTTKIIYFTDGYGESKIEEIYNQYVMWVYTPNGHREVEMASGNRYQHIELPQSFFEKKD